ncbi:hypothetical protein IEQ34_009842 [Dendrobium chrysotoxum]|uniref:Uncharacterized protein n=1 Tax=Dendrobium chrysotoxum TaxID=161865 RepID=A0AAV7H072_DENCH|nr:hypothetical protein IEQ34_009842 [Dendrobium chrysotoxum]
MFIRTARARELEQWAGRSTVGARPRKQEIREVRRARSMAATSSSYPPPPPYYRLYKDFLEDPTSAPEPPSPIRGPYPLYSATYTTDVVLPSLEDQGVRQLYPKGPNIGMRPFTLFFSSSSTRKLVLFSHHIFILIF